MNPDEIAWQRHVIAQERQAMWQDMMRLAERESLLDRIEQEQRPEDIAEYYRLASSCGEAMPQREGTGTQPADSVIYLIGPADGGLTKIGCTTDVPRRLAEIQRMSPMPLTVLWTEPGGRDHESRLHALLADKRSHGEWFDLGPDPLETLLAAKMPFYRALLNAEECLREAAYYAKVFAEMGVVFSPEQVASIREKLDELGGLISELEVAIDRNTRQ